MPVNTPHPDYATKSPLWKKCRDVYDGQDAVHSAGEAYLPKLKDQTSDDYKGYLSRATFYNATYRTINGLIGMLFRQAPVFKVPKSVEPLLDDVTLSGVPMAQLAYEVAEDALTVGREGILVDYPQAETGALTQADAKTMNLRPMMNIYKAESIINWRCESRNNRRTLVLVILEEATLITVDEFTSKSEKRWRVLDLDAGKYRVRMYMRNEASGDVLLSTVYPLLNGKPLDFIPFVFISTDSLTDEVDNPPLIDLVNVNLSHYRSTADLEHGAHFTGLPTPWVSGYKQEDKTEKLYIGSARAWVFPSKDAKVGYLEFTGTGLKAIDEMLSRKESQMAVLGARMLEPQKKGVETADTASIHRKGEESMLSAMAQTISMGLTQALEWFCLWAGAADEEASAELNRDFYPVMMTPEELGALVAAWQAGAISDQTLFENLQAGDIIDSETTLEQEQARIGSKAPALQGDGSPAPKLLRPPSENHTVVVQPSGSKTKTVTKQSNGTYLIQEH